MFVFCVESSHTRGMGHLFRSLILADEARKMGKRVLFLVNNHKQSIRLISERKYEFSIISFAPDFFGWEKTILDKLNVKVWINDRLNTTLEHVKFVKSYGIPVVTFDDRGSGAALSNLNIAALIYDREDIRNIQGMKVLTGVEYMVLNPSIEKYKRLRTQTNSILITLGGADTHGVTIKVVKYLREKNIKATVITGPAFSHGEELASILPYNYELKTCVPCLIEEMAHHDLAITGGGITPFEANASGLPCLVIANELFEIQVGEALERMGGCLYLGYWESLSSSDFKITNSIKTMSEKGMSLISINGTKRVITAISNLVKS